MRVLVGGGREFSDTDLLFTRLDALHAKYGFTELIHGAARGADSMAGDWAIARAIPVRAFPANWDKHRRRAGPIRNKQMLDEGNPEMVVAFPGGTGTANMRAQSEARGIPVIIIEAE